MISSEVQRTLVKSPPELWAELSDQASLARHLGDLDGIGEIRITKIEPETLVEWEAEGATGSVAIKASGWGTKVTLQVSRELPTGAEATPEAPALETDVEEAPAAEGEAEPGSEAPALPEAGTEGMAEATSEAPALEAQDEPESAPETVSDAEPAKAEAESEPRALAEPPIPEPESRPLTAAERFAPEFPPSLHGELLQAELTVEPVIVETTAPQPQLDPEPIKRRGFFARLFGWGKRPAEPEQAVEPAAAHLPGPLEPGQAIEPPPTSEPEPTSEVPAEQPALHAEALDEQPLAEEREAQESCAQTPEAEPVVAKQPTPEPEVQEPDSSQEQSDLAAELLAAEEQVTAVLTSVLDRLGSAHHRPFSRA